MKYKILNLKFSFIALLMNTALLGSTYASAEVEEHKAPSPTALVKQDCEQALWNTLLTSVQKQEGGDQKKNASPQGTLPKVSRDLEDDFHVEETTHAVYTALIKWHEEKTQPPSWLSLWNRSDKRFDSFTPTRIQYVRIRNDKWPLLDQYEMLVAQNKTLADQMLALNLNMLAHSTVVDLLQNRLTTLSVDIDDETGETILIVPTDNNGNGLQFVEVPSEKGKPSITRLNQLEEANPFFVEALTLKGQTLTHLSFNDVLPLVKRFANLSALSLEFNKFDRRSLTPVLSVVPQITSLTLEGNLNPSQLRELIRMPEFIQRLAELRLYDASKTPDPAYAAELENLFNLRPNIKVLGLSASANHSLSKFGFYTQLGNRLRSLERLELLGLTPAHPIFTPSNQILYYLINGFGTFRTTFPDDPTLLDRIIAQKTTEVAAEKAQAPLTALPVVSG